MGTKIDAATIAEPFRADVRKAVAECVSKGHAAPLLVGLLANDDPAALQYAEWTGKACRNDGIQYQLRKVDKMDVEAELDAINKDPSVHGIIIYYPCFGNHPSFYGGSMDDYLRDSISITKDVEGLCFTYRYNLYHNIRYLDEHKQHKCLLPCTPLAVVKILEHLKVYPVVPENAPESLLRDRLMGKNIVIFNRSEIVGRPLAAMLANDGADVYSIDISTMYLMRRGKLSETTETPETACKKADVIITGVPSKDFRLQTSWVKEGTVVINVASFKNVDEEALTKIKDVRYVPMVGKVTVAILERNLLRLFNNFHLKTNQ